jgi:hypothetical protein
MAMDRIKKPELISIGRSVSSETAHGLPSHHIFILSHPSIFMA